MKSNKTSRTAQYMAFFRALETKRPAYDRLFTDPYAIHFLDTGLKIAVHASRIPAIRNYIRKTIQKKIPGAFSSGLARTKYIDALVQQTISNGVKQLMLLGAGFDTRAMRLDFLKSVPVIEIDHPNTSNFKSGIFQQLIDPFPENITRCQIDFNEQSLDALAVEHNFDFTRPTMVIWEGVTNYLSEEAVQKTFSFISRFPKGSYVIVTYVHRDVLTHPEKFLGGKKLLKDVAELEERWTWGTTPEELPAFLKPFGFTLQEDLGATEYRKKYIPNRSEEGYEFYRTALAKKE